MVKTFKTLIIGYGNTLRRDDGIGQILAQDIAELYWPNCQTLSVHQLTPELAAAITAVERVIFIDAYIADAASNPPLRIEKVEATEPTAGFGHRSDPGELLALTQILYNKTVLAWQVLIPAIDITLGETLSPPTEQARTTALAAIWRLVQVS
jgi:hydrogenase maturation protease